MDNKHYLSELKYTTKFLKRNVIREQENPDHINMIKEWFKKNPNPKDDDFHNFAEKHLGIDPSEAEEIVYSILTTYLKIGKHQDHPDAEYDSEQLKMGIQVEYEHTDDPLVSKEIAKDHLAEIPDYYTRLKKMEKEAGVKD